MQKIRFDKCPKNSEPNLKFYNACKNSINSSSESNSTLNPSSPINPSPEQSTTPSAEQMVCHRSYQTVPWTFVLGTQKIKGSQYYRGITKTIP